MLNKIYEKVKNYIVNNYKFLIALILIVFICTYEFPYVVYTPGGIVKLNDRIKIEDEYDMDGSLNMSYVSLMRGKLPILAFSFLMKDWDIVKSDDITLEDQSVSDLLKMEKIYMASSIDSATLVAYQKAGKKIDIKSAENNVIYLTEEAKTDIKVYDQVLEVEGIKVDNINDLKKVIEAKEVGDKVNILVKRDGKELNTESVVYNSSDGKKIGVMFLPTYEYETDPKITVKTKEQESGSSGGLMLTLAIYNKLTKDDITKGKKIVGTGTIDNEGNVGAIDGVKYKVLGAENNKADIFLCPEENYEEASKIKRERKLKLVVKSVATFDEAIDYLNSLD